MTQNEAVIETMMRLGGVATLGTLNEEVFKIKECEWRTKTPFASIRRIVQLNKHIYKIKPGLYGLESFRTQLEDQGYMVETAKNSDSQEMDAFNHSYYQGLLLELGNLEGWQTYVPNQDKNKKFLQKKLDDIRSVKDLPEFSYDDLVKRSATIDVIWLNDRDMPHSFFEIEHSTDIQNSLLKYNDLQDFNVKMFIVADRKRKDEFLKKLHYSAFKDISQRVRFFDYNSLSKFYENEVQRTSLGVAL